MCKYVTFVLWMLMNASWPALDSHVHVPFLNYFCFRNSGENRGERDLRGSPRDCRYDTAISFILVIYCIPVILVIPVVWVVPFVPNSLVNLARARLSACLNCKYFPLCTSLQKAHVSSHSSPLRDVSWGGTSATQRQKFHTDDVNQCLLNKSGSYGVPNGNLFNFAFLLVVFRKVWCSSANELQQNSNAFSREDYIPQILTVLLEIHCVYIWPLPRFVFCLSFVSNS